MLPLPNRLKAEQDIKRVFERGTNAHDDACGLKYAKNGLSVSRVAVVVGTKVSKKAVVRNRIRRQIRAAIARHLLNVPQGFDLIFMAKGKAIGQPFPEIEGAVVRLLTKANLLKKTAV